MTAKKPHTFIYLITTLLSLLLLTYTAAAQQTEHPDRAGLGYIDSITFDGTRVTAQGWAATEQASQQIISIEVLLDGKSVYKGPFERFQRPDVVNSFNRPEWLGSGWRISFDLPEDVNVGVFGVTAVALTRGGESIALLPTSIAEKLSIALPPHEAKKLVLKIKIVIACAAALLALCFLKAAPLSQWVNRTFRTALSEPLMFGLCVSLVACLFVAIGLTGSSLRLGQASAPFIQMDAKNILAHEQPVRSDEWLVMTPLAIAQYNHEPRFPVLNNNIGEDGQNMLIIGMTGAPVSHLSAIAKPATWGFFVFDLRRALSWSWCFPVFGCFLALAFVLNALSGGNWKYGFVFSAVFCCTPYVVAWSYWPAYTVFFPSIAFLCALQILKTSSLYKLFLLGLILGLAGAGFVLVLYPAWQVSVGYVFAILMIGMLIRDRLYTAITLRKAAAYIVAITVAGIIISAWWVDARGAVEAMQNTVYPGRRFAVGGGATLPQLLRGFTNISTLVQLNSPISNQSEIASFYYLLLPLAALFVIEAKRRTLSALEWSVAIMTSFILLYMFSGVPAVLARYSLWSNVTSVRADLALGLCSLILSHLLLTRNELPAKTSKSTQLIAISISLAWIYVVYRSLNGLDRSLLSGLNSSIITAILITTAAISYCLITRKIKPFLYVTVAFSFATSSSFNPVNIAPKNIQINPSLKKGATPFNFIQGRILVLESTQAAMLLAASGASVVNGIFYYPQASLWKRLDPSAKSADVYNRYQHLIYLGAPSSAAPFTIGTPQADVVTVSVNLQTFDFNLSGANIVLSPDIHKAELSANSGLSFIMSADGWSWFEVINDYDLEGQAKPKSS